MSVSAAKPVRAIRLSKANRTYLANAKFLPDDLQQLIDAAMQPGNAEQLLEVDADTAEWFRDEFTTRLARVGFGPDYTLTREGELLEELIDRFAE